MALFLVLIIAVDQITKYFASLKLMPIKSVTAIKGILDFTYVENYGAAFGILKGAKWFFLILTLALAVGIIRAFKKMPVSKEYSVVRVSLIMILGGALGNAIDRLFRGFVVDFFEVTFIKWPVFNIADIFVVSGAFLMAYMVIFRIKD